MEFKFSKKEELLQWAVNDFADKELSGKELAEQKHIPAEIIKKMGALGFLGLWIPEQYGGKPQSWVMRGILIEELSKINITTGYLIMLSCEIGLILANHAKEEIKRRWLPGLSQGIQSGCLSMTEPNGGSDVASIKTKAIRIDNSYILSGEKIPVSFGIQADFTILFAKTDLEGGAKGISAFLVPLDLPEITKSLVPNMGLLPSSSAQLIFNEVRVPWEYRIGEEGEGFEINARSGLSSDFSQILSGLVSLGLSQTALRLAISYAKKRVAFGRPIAQFEAISGKIAEDATFIEAARWLCYRALWLKDQGSPSAKEAAMCGWWCPKVAFKVIEDALLIHGHTGYSDDLPFQQMLRDVTAFELIAGTEELLKLIIAQKTIGKVAVPSPLANDFG